MEKRNIKRQGIDASTVCSHFATSKNTEVYDAKMLNYSEGGMCIESNADFKKGAIVLVKVKALFSNAGYPGLMESFSTVSLGEIKWSTPSHDAGKALFGISAL
ncbi:MAG: PilZ domain-containing protein, partial [Desulfobacterales bacterium]